jgi:hypothetical protein
MSVATAPASPTFKRGAIIAVILVALAAALATGIATRPDIANLVGERFGNAVSQGVRNGVDGIKTVAAMMAERSPGERAKGALASLKNKRPAGIHERALPKVRKPTPPVSPLAAIVAGPPVPPLIPPAAPLFNNLVSGSPTPVVPLVTGGPTGGGGGNGSPPPFVSITPPGGGGGIIVPPTTTTETPPPPPPPSAVPEPNTWALMLVGFGLVGFAVRRDRRRVALAATE